MSVPKLKPDKPLQNAEMSQDLHESDSAENLQTAESLRVSSFRPFLIAAAWVAVSFIWGSTWLFTKIALHDLPPFMIAGLRTFFSAVLLTLYVAYRRVPLPRERGDWLIIAVTGFLLFSVNYGLAFWGLNHISSGLAAVLGATLPIFGFLLAHRFLPDERLSPLKILGVGMGVVGVLLIFSHQLEAKTSLFLWGATAILVSAFSVALATVLIKAHGKNLDRATLIAGQMWFGVIPLFIIGYFTEPSPLSLNWNVKSVLVLCYLTLVGSIFALVLFYWLIKQIDATKTMTIYLAVPLIAVISGMLVLGETLTWRIFIGGVAILTGVGLIVMIKKELPVGKMMKVENCILSDLETILLLYESARQLQRRLKMVEWHIFEIPFIEFGINEKRQWKLINNDGTILCIWTITFEDKDIWEEKEKGDAIYIHRIATNPDFRGNKYIIDIVAWAKNYASALGRKYIRLDTLGNNVKLIEHYTQFGFDFLGVFHLKNTTNLPKHYHSESSCLLFEIALTE